VLPSVLDLAGEIVTGASAHTHTQSICMCSRHNINVKGHLMKLFNAVARTEVERRGKTREDRGRVRERGRIERLQRYSTVTIIICGVSTAVSGLHWAKKKKLVGQ